MQVNDMLVLRGNEILTLLNKQEQEIIHLVHDAYIAHAQGESSLPHSTFLHFPNDTRNRIIALPAYLGANFGLAGVKWVSSFPQNIVQGLDRAAAVIIVNSIQTGIPMAILEGSVINAKRTAASAALAAASLQEGKTISCLGFIGCGLINFEILRFLRVAFPDIKKIILFDIDGVRATQFERKCIESYTHLEIGISHTINDVLKNCNVVSLATNTGTPYIFDLTDCSSDSLLLHISLRDIAPEVLLTCDNIVDDSEHVLRAQTSLHLAQQLSHEKDFIRCSLADVLLKREPARKAVQGPTVFSPFGLGILDLALSKFVYDMALEKQLGVMIPSFLPTPWHSRSEQSTR